MAISRERQDELALQLHRRAELAPREDDVVAVPVGASVVDRDELARPGASPEELAALPPLFREDGTITVGNSAPMADGAAAVVLMSAERARDLGAPLGAAVSAYARRGTTEGAIRAALARHVDIIELDEPFAARLLAVIDELELDPERVNPSGGVIALGRPIGATGALSAVRLLAEMRRGGHRAGLVAVGGVALVLELAARSTAASGP
jgi:acetyl-CoA C-acetyltransferase